MRPQGRLLTDAAASRCWRRGGDRVTLGRGTVTVGFENRGRSPHGELTDVYRFVDGRYG